VGYTGMARLWTSGSSLTSDCAPFWFLTDGADSSHTDLLWPPTDCFNLTLSPPCAQTQVVDGVMSAQANLSTPEDEVNNLISQVWARSMGHVQIRSWSAALAGAACRKHAAFCWQVDAAVCREGRTAVCRVEHASRGAKCVQRCPHINHPSSMPANSRSSLAWAYSCQGLLVHIGHSCRWAVMSATELWA